jgi:uncharacterized protein (DUF427 family)
VLSTGTSGPSRACLPGQASHLFKEALRVEIRMKAILNGQVIAESDDIVECAGYRYFPRAAVRMELLEQAPRTADDLECPHGVQFYDVVLDGARHGRAAWSYQAPRPRMQQVAGRVGFWQDVEVR